MTPSNKTVAVLATSSVVFLGLAAMFALDRQEHVARMEIRPAASLAISPVTVRISAENLIRTGGDTSILDCYACHDDKKKASVPIDVEGRVTLPADHADLIFSMRNCVACHAPASGIEVTLDKEGMTIIPEAHAGDRAIRHGATGRNSTCFNCHNPEKLDQLVTRDGTQLRLDQATLLCASCHGPTYRDWEVGIHGKTSGHWNADAGDRVREGCADCHDPHNPTFPLVIPLPGPHAATPAIAHP
jgi:cytochrome c551/c552